MGFFWAKYILFELKKYGGVIFHDIEEWCKIWKKNDLLFRKWYQEFGKFSPERSKMSKLELWWDPFVQSRKCMCLKFTVELCVMAMKNDTKIEEELTCRFEIDMRNFINFDLSTQKSKRTFFYLAPCDQSIYCLSYKSTEELSFGTLRSYADFEEKLTSGLKKVMRNLTNSHQSTWKCQNWDFDIPSNWDFCPK